MSEYISDFFNEWTKRYGEQHELGKMFYELMIEVEKLPASEQQTKIAMMIDKLKNDVSVHIEIFENEHIKPMKSGAKY